MHFVKTVVRLVLYVVLGSVIAFQMPWLSASIPFYNEPPRLNIQFYSGFREDYLRFHLERDKKIRKRNDFCQNLEDHKPMEVVPVPQDKGKDKSTKERRRDRFFIEANWRDLKISQVGATINYSTKCHGYYIRANADYGRILQGDGKVRSQFDIVRECVIDHNPKKDCNRCRKRKKELCPHCGEIHAPTCDHGENNPDKVRERLRHHHVCKELSKQEADAGFGYVYDLTGGVGWKVVSGGGRGWVAGIVGYSYNRQRLKMRRFEQNKDSLNILDPTPLQHLHGSYLTAWDGPWAGIDFMGHVECDVDIFGTGEWHYVNYRGEGHWSIRDEFSARMNHHTRGYGAVAVLGFDWHPCSRWGVGVIANYQQWSTRKGHTRAKVRNCTPISDELVSTFPLSEKSTLFRVRWWSFSISALLSYEF